MEDIFLPSKKSWTLNLIIKFFAQPNHHFEINPLPITIINWFWLVNLILQYIFCNLRFAKQTKKMNNNILYCNQQRCLCTWFFLVFPPHDFFFFSFGSLYTINCTLLTELRMYLWNQNQKKIISLTYNCIKLLVFSMLTVGCTLFILSPFVPTP